MNRSNWLLGTIAVLGGLLFPLLVQGQTTVTLRPTSDGSIEQWNNNAGSACTGQTCFVDVDETSGSTNCASSTFVPGDGAINRSPATTALTQQYSLTLTTIPNGAIITSITVHACEARGGATNTSGTLRIVLNGGTTTCGTNQSVTATFTDLSCTFSSLNTAKSGGTTLEIGNTTTQNRNISVDSIEAEVTYTTGQIGTAASSVHLAPAVTAVKTNTKSVAASVAFEVPCCATLTVPGKPAQAVHIAPTVTGTRSASNQPGNISQALHLNQSIAVVRAMKQPGAQTVTFGNAATAIRTMSRAAAASCAFEAPVCVLTTYPLNQPLHISPVVNISSTAGSNKSAASGVTLNFGNTVLARHAVVDNMPVALHFGALASIIISRPAAQALSISPAVTGVKGGNSTKNNLASVHFGVVCNGCKGNFFQSIDMTVLATATGVPNRGRLNQQALHLAPVVTTVLGSKRPGTQSLHFGAVATASNVASASISQQLRFFLGVQVTGPAVANKTVNINVPQLHFTVSADEDAVTSSRPAQAASFAVVASASAGLNKAINQALHITATATAFGRTPGRKFVIVVAD